MEQEENKGYSVVETGAFVKSKRGGKKGNKGGKGGSKSVLEGGAPRKTDHLCWGPKCEGRATRLAGLPSGSNVSLVPLCPSCAGKVKRRAEKKNLPAPAITPMSRKNTELYKLATDNPTEVPSESTKAVDKLISSLRAGSDEIYSYGEGKRMHQTPGGRYVRPGTSGYMMGNPKANTSVVGSIADMRRRKEAENLTLRALRGEFDSLKNKD